MDSLATPNQATKTTQTLPTPKVTLCIPLEMKEEDARKRYCYHGGKCLCPGCEQERLRQLEDIEEEFDKFMPDDRLQLEPAIRQVSPKLYSIPAKRISPDFARRMIRQHEEIRKKVPIYYLPDKYYLRDAFKYPKPNNVTTQTEIRIGMYGIEGCPCVDKSRCWDMP